MGKHAGTIQERTKEWEFDKAIAGFEAYSDRQVRVEFEFDLRDPAGWHQPCGTGGRGAQMSPSSLIPTPLCEVDTCPLRTFVT